MDGHVKVEYVDAQMVLRLTVDGRSKYVTTHVGGDAVKPMLDLATFAFNAAVATGQATADEIWDKAEEILAAAGQ